MTRKEIIALINAERNKQDKKWGRNFPGRSQTYWLGILTEEIGEIAKATIEEEIGLQANVEEELIHAAAVIFSWLELGMAKEEKND